MAKKKTTRTKSRTKKSGITEVRKVVNVSAESDDITHRVFKWDAALRTALKDYRETMGLTNQELIREAVKTQLPQLVQELANLGIAVEDRKTVGPCRVPMEMATLKALRMASNWTDLPQNLLLQACLRLATR